MNYGTLLLPPEYRAKQFSTTSVLSSDLLFAKFCQHVARKHLDMCKDSSLSSAHVENVAKHHETNSKK